MKNLQKKNTIRSSPLLCSKNLKAYQSTYNNKMLSSSETSEVAAITVSLIFIIFFGITFITHNLWKQKQVIPTLSGYLSLDNEEKLEIQNAFKLFNMNGSGEINRKDFISAMNLQRREVENKTMYDLIVESAMTQNEPTVNFDQFVETMME
jgi:hypothetical protein